MPTRVLSVIVVLATLLLIRAQLAGDAMQGYLFKPLAIAACIALAWRAAPRPSARYRTLILLGLLASSVGDVLLMLPQDLFAFGLGAFFVAHLLYIRAFVTPPPGRTLAVAPLVGLLPLAGVVAWVIWPGVPSALRVPVLCYLVAIVTMAWQAMGRALARPGAAATSAAIGATLFVVSDAALAINRFRYPFAWSPVVVLGTYFAAQWCIARSVGADDATA